MAQEPHRAFPRCRLHLAAVAACHLLAALPSQRPTSGGSGGDRERHVADDPVARRIAAIVDASPSLGFSGAVLAAWDGRVLFAGGAGLADAGSARANTARTLFEIASASKPITAIAVCRLAQKKKLRLDDPLAKHVEGVPEDCAEITLRHLLQHTSGIPGSNSRGGGDDLAAVLPLFLEGGPRHAPGTHWEYWNQGYALLAAVVAEAGARDFRDVVRREVFEPAKMASSVFTGDDAPAGAEVATGVSARGADRSALAHPYGSFGYQYRGMGGVVTNVWDLWRLDRALSGEKLLRRELQREMFRPGPGDYGLGWFVREVTAERKHLEQSHTGSVRGFLADVRRYPDDDGCVIVLCNRDDAPVGSIASLVADALRGVEVEPPPPMLGAGLAASMAGVFRAADGVEVVVEAQPGGAVTFTVHWGPGGAPESTKTSRWTLGRGEREGDVVAFDGQRRLALESVRSENGKVTSFALDDWKFERTR